MARNLIDILNDAHKAMELSTQKALTGPPRDSKVCFWCQIDGELAAQRHEGPHLTWCPYFKPDEWEYTTREPEEFEREAPAHCEDREDTEEIR